MVKDDRFPDLFTFTSTHPPVLYQVPLSVPFAMPPRQKKTTPKAAERADAPPAPRRVTRAARFKSAILSLSLSFVFV